MALALAMAVAMALAMAMAMAVALAMAMAMAVAMAMALAMAMAMAMAVAMALPMAMAMAMEVKRFTREEIEAIYPRPERLAPEKAKLAYYGCLLRRAEKFKGVKALKWFTRRYKNKLQTITEETAENVEAILKELEKNEP